MSDAPAAALDPITLEIYWNRLISAADEAATGLLRDGTGGQAAER